MKYLIILVLSLLGFFLAGYINLKTERKEKLVCVIGNDCNKVIKSKYGKTFGMDNTFLGMIYYLVVLILALDVLIFPWIVSVGLFYWVFFLITLGAALFSVYLTIIQLFVIKELCEYCLLTALNTILIFVLFIVL